MQCNVLISALLTAGNFKQNVNKYEKDLFSMTRQSQSDGIDNLTNRSRSNTINWVKLDCQDYDLDYLSRNTHYSQENFIFGQLYNWLTLLFLNVCNCSCLLFEFLGLASELPRIGLMAQGINPNEVAIVSNCFYHIIRFFLFP